MADLTTLANVKQWLNITSNADDALLTRLISAASDYIQTWLNRNIAAQTYTETRDGAGGSRMMFANYPVTSVSVVQVNGNNIPQSLNPLQSGWVADAFKVSMRLGTYSFDRGVQNIVLTYIAGYATTPNEIEQSCIEMIGMRYKEKDRIGLVSKGLAGETITFSQKDMSDAIESTLKNYKKVITV